MLKTVDKGDCITWDTEFIFGFGTSNRMKAIPKGRVITFVVVKKLAWTPKTKIRLLARGV